MARVRDVNINKENGQDSEEEETVEGTRERQGKGDGNNDASRSPRSRPVSGVQLRGMLKRPYRRQKNMTQSRSLRVNVSSPIRSGRQSSHFGIICGHIGRGGK